MLSKLNLVQGPAKTIDKFEQAKGVLVIRLEQQLKALEALVLGEPSKLSDRQKWYYRANGKMYFKVKVKNSVLTLGTNGKVPLCAVEVGDDTNGPTVVEEIQKAVHAGELDDAIRACLDSRKPNKRKA